MPSVSVVLALVVLALACTAGGFVGYFSLIQEAGAGRAAVVTYVNPAVAVVLGALVLDEPVGLSTLAAFALILVGSWLATRGGSPEAQPAPAAGE
jgi:drug/metabolite transporter (DMT)-like permease